MQYSKFLSNNPNYPRQLLEISQPPKQLHLRGELPPGTAVAIVGSRKPTDYGRRVTYKLSYDLARAGVVVISGLALGVDGVAHQAAIEAGGKTIAVLGTAIDYIYPASNRGLAEKIINGHGAVVSEYAPGEASHPGTFPARNRIIAGLASAVVVTEAAAASGSLITARFALDQNRTVMAVPGNITSPMSAGPNNLIKSGAIPITDATDVLAALNLYSAEITSTPVRAKSPEEARVLELLAGGINESQALIEQSGLTAQQFANVITLMEITGKVRNLGAGQWIAG